MATLTSEYQYLGRSARMAPKNGNNYGYYILLYAKTDADLINGIHTVSIRQVIACSINSSFYQFGSTSIGTINGQTVYTVYNRPSAAWSGSLTAGGVTYPKHTIIEEGTLAIDASNGVELQIPLSLYYRIDVEASSSGFVPAKGTAGSVGATVTLAAIPRQSTVTATDAYIDSTSIITIKKNVASYTHTLSYRMAGQSDFTVIAEKITEEQYSWKVPTDAYALIPSAREIAITIRCETFNGDNLIGENDTTMYATVRESISSPDLNATAEDVNESTIALTGDSKKLVKGFSNLRVISTAVAKNSAAISSVVVKVGGKTANGSDVTLEGVESSDVTVTATDSRGFPSSKTIEGLSLIPYTPLTINPTAARLSPTSDVVQIYADGSFYNGDFGMVFNALAVKARSRLLGGEFSDYTELKTTIAEKTYTASGQLTGLSYNSIYEVEVTAFDAVYTSGKTWTYRINKGIPMFDYGEDDFNFNVPVRIQGKPLVSSTAPLVFVGTPISSKLINITIPEGLTWEDLGTYCTDCNIRINEDNGSKVYILDSYSYSSSNAVLSFGCVYKGIAYAITDIELAPSEDGLATIVNHGFFIAYPITMKKIKVLDAEASITIYPNQMWCFNADAMTSLTIRFGVNSVSSTSYAVYEYRFRFISGDTPTTLSLPSTVIGDIDIEINHVYEISIVDNYLTYQSWEI